MIVIDASAIVEWVLQSPRGMKIYRSAHVDSEWHAPHLLDLEVLQVFRKLTLKKLMSTADAERALEAYLLTPISRHAHASLSLRIWDLRHNMSAYDAAYIALAESLNARLITCDARLSSASGHDVRVEAF